MGLPLPEDAVIAPPDPADKPPRFRWRIVPALFGILYGVAATLGGLANSAVLVWFAARGSVPPRVHVGVGFLTAAATTVGGVALTAGCVAAWRGRFRPAGLLCTVGVAVLVVVSLFGSPVLK